MSHDGRSLAAIESLQHMLDDADVRRNLARGAGAIQRASGVVSRDRKRAVTKASRRTQMRHQLQEAVTAFGRVGAAAREAELKRQRSRRRRRRLVMVLAVSGAGLATGLALRANAGEETDRGDGAAGPQAPWPAPAAVEMP